MLAVDYMGPFKISPGKRHARGSKFRIIKNIRILVAVDTQRCPDKSFCEKFLLEFTAIGITSAGIRAAAAP
jgi:hypothetical protein